MKSINDYYILNNDVKIPALGFGTFQTPDNEVGVNSVLKALEVGYRHIDTAAGYRNEASVGKAIKLSGIDRNEIFITSKLKNADHGYDATVAGIEDSLKKLETDYIDLYLVHWPNPLKFRDNWKAMNAETWKAFEEYYNAGKIKAIGVSNFRPHHLEALLETATIIPAVNQIRLCPGDIHEETYTYCKEKNILLEAYSPLGQGAVFSVPEIKALESKYNKTVAQICLRWSLDKGFLPLPKSVTAERIIANADIFDFELEVEDVNMLTEITGKCGLAKDPDVVPF